MKFVAGGPFLYERVMVPRPDNPSTVENDYSVGPVYPGLLSTALGDNDRRSLNEKLVYGILNQPFGMAVE